jgi:hypothetical protein
MGRLKTRRGAVQTWSLVRVTTPKPTPNVGAVSGTVPYHMALANIDKKSKAKAVDTRWHRVKRERGERQKIENLGPDWQHFIFFLNYEWDQ